MDDECEYEYAAALIAIASALVLMFRGNGIIRNPRTNMDDRRQAVLRKFYMESDRVCMDNLRMGRDNFNRLCCRLKTLGLSDSRYLVVEEQVAMFLYTVGHDMRNRNNVMQFYRSGQTVSHYFHQVLTAVLHLVHQVVKNATTDNSPIADCTTERDWHHYFKDAVGAVDGTHFQTKVPIKDQGRYRNRKGVVSQNVLVACTFDLRFTYVLAGWEGSAHDGKLLRDAVSRNLHKLTVPQGKYYLADAGFALVPGFLTPYRSTRYHLREQTNPPQNAKELFNFRHSSLRTVVERAIGILKMRFAYLRHRPYHDVKTHAKIIIACCGIHNWLREQNDNDDDDFGFDPTIAEPNQHVAEDADNINVEMTTSGAWTAHRDALAEQMWTNR